MKNERAFHTASFLTEEEVEEVLKNETVSSNSDSDSNYSSEGSDYVEDKRPVMKMVESITADIKWIWILLIGLKRL